MRNQFPKLCPSRLRDLPCPKRFHTLHVLRNGPRQEWSQPLVYGTACHRLLRVLYDPAIDTPPTERDVERLARGAFAEQHYPDPDARASDLARAIRMAGAYVAHDADALHTLAVEVNDDVTLRDGKVRPFGISAKYDRLIVRPDDPEHLVLRDYKTGAPGSVDLEAACIMLAVAKLRNKEYSEFSLEFDYVGNDGLDVRQNVTLAEAKLKWPELRSRAAHVYDATEFPAEPGEHCMWCPLRAECRPDLTVDLTELDSVFE